MQSTYISQIPSSKVFDWTEIRILLLVSCKGKCFDALRGHSSFLPSRSAADMSPLEGVLGRTMPSVKCMSTWAQTGMSREMLTYSNWNN